jgi:hypothetical protein
MRGSPPIQLFLLVLAFIVLAIPLAHLTGNAPAEAPKAEKASAKPLEADSLLRVRFVHKPEKLSVKLGGKDLLEKGTWSDGSVEFQASLPRSLDLLVSCEWPYGAPDQALTLEIEPDGLEMKSQTHWSAAGGLSEVYSFQW